MSDSSLYGEQKWLYSRLCVLQFTIFEKTHIDLNTCSITTNEQCSVAAEVERNTGLSAYPICHVCSLYHTTSKAFATPPELSAQQLSGHYSDSQETSEGRLTYSKLLHVRDRIGSRLVYWTSWLYCLINECNDVMWCDWLIGVERIWVERMSSQPTWPSPAPKRSDQGFKPRASTSVK